MSTLEVFGTGALRRAEPRELGDQAACDDRCQERFAGGDDAHRFEERLGRSVLEQEPAGAGLERVVDVFVQVECRQDEDPRTGVAGGGANLAGRGDAVEHRHPDVHQHDVGPVLLALLHRLFAVCCGCDDGDVALGLEQRGEACADGLLVVGDQGADHGAASVVGSVTSTSKPPPGAEPERKVPPARVARSRIPISPWPSSGPPLSTPGP